MNKALCTVAGILSLLYSNYTEAMFLTTQNLPIVGPAIFTGKELKCLICFTKKTDGEFFLLLKHIPSTPQSTSMFTIPETTNLNPLSQLYTTLFPGELKNSFIFDSGKLNDYKAIINYTYPTNNNPIWTNWWNAKRSNTDIANNLIGLKRTMTRDIDIKNFLSLYLDTFVKNIKALITIDRLAESENTLSLIGQTVISNTTSLNKNDMTPDQKRDLIKSKLGHALFGNFQTLPLRSFNDFARLSDKEVTDLESIVKFVMMAQICYICDLAKADLTSILPRALYREVQKLGSVLGFGVASFDTFIHRNLKNMLLGIGALSATSWLYSKSKGLNNDKR